MRIDHLLTVSCSIPRICGWLGGGGGWGSAQTQMKALNPQMQNPLWMQSPSPQMQNLSPSAMHAGKPARLSYD